MPLLRWLDTFNTGIASVDYEHRQLVDMINMLYERLIAGDAQEQDIGEFLAALHDRIAAHFALEERIMRERQYIEYREHKAEHEHLLDEIRDLMEAERVGAFRGAAGSLADRLERWFSGHFGTMDVRLHHAIGV